MNTTRSPLPLLALSAAALMLVPHVRGATVLDQIGDLSAYTFGLGPDPVPSQVYPDFSRSDCTVVEDFKVTALLQRLTEVSVFFFAQTGFESFERVEGYHLNIYSAPAEAAKQLTGDVVSRFLPPAAVSVTKSTDPLTGDHYGLVKITVDIVLPAPGTYWVGVSPQASATAGGDFRVAAATASDTTNTGGEDNAEWANPGGGFGGDTRTPLGADYAISVVAVPEPGTLALLLLAGSTLLIRNRARGR